MKYIVEITGWTEIEIEAESEDEAIKIAENETPFGWDCDFDATLKSSDILIIEKE